jgi:transcriptional regulator with XRE-family HTH domain
MGSANERFGAFIRRKREAVEPKLGLREMARKIEVSPTYLSKVERDEFPPPAEDKVKAIARILGCDADDLLGRAGRVSSDLSKIIKERPREMATFLRAAKGASSDELLKWAERMKKSKDR